MATDYEQISRVYSNVAVDNYSDAQGVIDQLNPLDFNAPDYDLVRNLEARIQDSSAYWNQPEGYNLEKSRNQSQRALLGKQIDVTNLYRFQIPYIENQLFLANEAIVAYTTAQQAMPEVYPAQDTQRSKIFARDLEKALIAHSHKFKLQKLQEIAVRHLMMNRVGIIKLKFDPNYGQNGEIIPEIVDPRNVIFDKNARFGSNPAFICEVLKMTVEEMCSRWPNKKEEIYKSLNYKRGTPKQLSAVVPVREVHFTYFNDKYEASEVIVWYFNDVVLEKTKDINWVYTDSRKNFLDSPRKMYVLLNYINDGNHVIDNTTPIEQADYMQAMLNKRGRQIMENADKANGMLVISTESGMTADDAQNITGDPNQKLIITTQGRPVSELVHQVPAHDLPAFVVNDKMDIRSMIHAIMGTPSEFTGTVDGTRGEETLGQALLKKNQASGRQDLIIRAIDHWMTDYFNCVVQMMAVWYTEKHFFVYNGGDGDFDYITITRDLIEDGIAVTVKSGGTLPFDKSRQEGVALQLAKMGMISPLDLYKDLHMDNPQQRYDNWVKWKTDPMSLARSVEDQDQDNKAYMDYVEIMNGKKAEPRMDATTEHILTHRKQMLTEEFLKADRKKQVAFLEHLKAEVESLEARTALDTVAQQGVMGLDLFGMNQQPMPMPGAPTPLTPPAQLPMGAPEMGLGAQAPGLPMGGGPSALAGLGQGAPAPAGPPML